MIQSYKNSIAKRFLMDFCIVIMNSNNFIMVKREGGKR